MVTYHKLPRLHGFEGNIYGTPSFTCTIPSLEGASVWASDSSTQWLIVVTLICVRLHESLLKTIVTGISPQMHFHFRFGDTVTRFQVKQSFCSQLCHYASMAVATIEADEAVASSVFVQIMGTSLKKVLVRIILAIFGHFASSDFKVWLRWWLQQFCKYILHWMRIWAFAQKWLVIPWTRAALAVPCTYVDLCNRRDRHCDIVASAGYRYIRQKSPLQKGNLWK